MHTYTACPPHRVPMYVGDTVYQFKGEAVFGEMKSALGIRKSEVFDSNTDCATPFDNLFPLSGL